MAKMKASPCQVNVQFHLDIVVLMICKVFCLILPFYLLIQGHINYYDFRSAEDRAISIRLFVAYMNRLLSSHI
jgi:hypothetical protein